MASHGKVKRHQARLQGRSRSQGRQTFLQSDQLSLKEEVVFSFLAACIPLHRLNNPALKSQFATMGKVLPSKTIVRASVAQLTSERENQI